MKTFEDIREEYVQRGLGYIFTAEELNLTMNSERRAAITAWLYAMYDAGAEVIKAENTVLRKKLAVAENALRLIARGCGNYTRGNCREEVHGRRKDAQYTAERWCDACIAEGALMDDTFRWWTR